MSAACASNLALKLSEPYDKLCLQNIFFFKKWKELVPRLAMAEVQFSAKCLVRHLN